MKYAAIWVLLIGPLVTAGQAVRDCCLIRSVQGTVEVRAPYGESWEPVRPGEALTDRHTVRTGPEATARIEGFDGRILVLPSNAVVTLRDLRAMSRSELILELTALELQQLPDPGQEERSERAFVLHGAPAPESTPLPESVIVQEDNGAAALYAQNFLPGFILRWTRWHVAFPDQPLPKADGLIGAAYDRMEMPARKETAAE